MARSCADCWVKLPEISAEPLSVELTVGAETTWLSRAIAKRLFGYCCCESLPVIDANFFEPPPVKSI